MLTLTQNLPENLSLDNFQRMLEPGLLNFSGNVKEHQVQTSLGS